MGDGNDQAGKQNFLHSLQTAVVGICQTAVFLEMLF
jgi:hypothetical protein